jgi:hypothetical protein
MGGATGPPPSESAATSEVGTLAPLDSTSLAVTIPKSSFEDPLPVDQILNGSEWREIQIGQPFKIGNRDLDALWPREDVETAAGEMVIGVPVQATYVGSTAGDLSEFMRGCGFSALTTDDGKLREILYVFDQDDELDFEVLNYRLPDIRSGFSQEAVALYIAPEDFSDVRLVLTTEFCSATISYLSLRPIE